MLKIITRQLAKNLPPDHRMQENKVINPTNFKNIYNIFNSTADRELCIFDATITKQIKKNQTIQVRDHINKTGINILIGQQKTLDINFIDLSYLYTYDQNSIITECCGETLNAEKEYPSHYLCHIAILAKTMKFHKITGLLYNIIK